MKHLKKFNESLIRYPQMIEELQEFCEMNLAYLLDDDFCIDIVPYGSKFELHFYKSVNNMYTDFYWDEIKDIFIPFLITLDERVDRVGQEYNIEGIIFNYTFNNRLVRRKQNLTKLIDDKIDNLVITHIYIEI